MLFIPGYCVILTLFPKEGDIELTERIVLSVCVSLAIVPLIGLGLNFTPWGIRLDPIVIAITLFTLVMILAAYYQRSRLPGEDQFRMPFPDLAKAIRNEIFPSGNRRPAVRCCPGPGDPCRDPHYIFCDCCSPRGRTIYRVLHSG